MLPSQVSQILKEVSFLLSVLRGETKIEHDIQIKDEYILWD